MVELRFLSQRCDFQSGISVFFDGCQTRKSVVFEGCQSGKSVFFSGYRTRKSVVFEDCQNGKSVKIKGR